VNESIKKRLTSLERLLAPKDGGVMIELPNGRREKKSAVEWWAHRNEWPLADWKYQGNEEGLVLFLAYAAIADKGIEDAKAEGNASEVERLTRERDESLKKYFGDADE
jgi:hypothetical protein